MNFGGNEYTLNFLSPSMFTVYFEHFPEASDVSQRGSCRVVYAFPCICLTLCVSLFTELQEAVTQPERITQEESEQTLQIKKTKKAIKPKTTKKKIEEVELIENVEEIEKPEKTVKTVKDEQETVIENMEIQEEGPKKIEQVEIKIWISRERERERERETEIIRIII